MQKSFASNMLCSVSYTTLKSMYCILTSLLVKVPDQESVPGIHVHPAGFLVLV